MNTSKRSCRYWQACGGQENCQRCKGYEKKDTISKAAQDIIRPEYDAMQQFLNKKRVTN